MTTSSILDRSALGAERIPWIDSIRALALLGVIIMNVSAMQMLFVGQEVMARAGTADFIVMGFELIFIQGKARACFAILFGFGFATMMMRSHTRHENFASVYRRRMLALLAFGAINQAFLFWGDILFLYALLGLALLPCRKLDDRALLRLGLALVIIPPLVLGMIEARAGALPGLIELPPLAERGYAAMTSTNYWDFVRFSATKAVERRLTDTGHMIVYDLTIFGLFLLGSWAARRRIAADIDGWRPLLRKICLIAIPIGLLLSVATASRLAGVAMSGPAYGAVTAASAELPILAIGYLAAAALLFSRKCRWLHPLLVPAGRMPLTNYLLSGAIGGWFFFGYGLGMLGKLGLAETMGLAVLIFLALAVFSYLWLARFTTGPMEFLWRTMSYGTTRLRLPKTR